MISINRFSIIHFNLSGQALYRFLLKSSNLLGIIVKFVSNPLVLALKYVLLASTLNKIMVHYMCSGKLCVLSCVGVKYAQISTEV